MRAERVTLIPNASDLDLFSPDVDPGDLRERLGLERALRVLLLRHDGRGQRPRRRWSRPRCSARAARMSRSCSRATASAGRRSSEPRAAGWRTWCCCRPATRTSAARLAAASDACMTIFKDVPDPRHQLAEQAVRHLRRRAAGDREHGRLAARAGGATTGPGSSRGPATPADLAEQVPALRDDPERRARAGAQRARGWPRGSSTATLLAERLRAVLEEAVRGERDALLLRRQHQRPRLPAGLPGRDRAHPSGRGRPRGAGARQLLRRRLRGGRARRARHDVRADRARPPHRQGGERLDPAARGARRATACC